MTADTSQRGSATVFGASVAALILLVTVALVPLLIGMSVRIEADTAADAAALAAVSAAVEGRHPGAAASEIASANGARLERCRCPAFEDRTITATVAVSKPLRLPLVGDYRIHVERSAQYWVDP